MISGSNNSVARYAFVRKLSLAYRNSLDDNFPGVYGTPASFVTFRNCRTFVKADTCEETGGFLKPFLDTSWAIFVCFSFRVVERQLWKIRFDVGSCDWGSTQHSIGILILLIRWSSCELCGHTCPWRICLFCWCRAYQLFVLC